MGSPAYMQMQGRPVIFLYGMEAYQLNWTTIRSSLPGNPILVFRPATGGSMQVMAGIVAPGRRPSGHERPCSTSEGREAA